MKKLISVMLVILALFGASAAMAEIESFTPVLINSMEFSADEWYESDLNRALLTVLMGLEAATRDSSFDLFDFLTYETYVRRYDENSLIVYFISETKACSMLYMVNAGTATLPDDLGIENPTGMGETFKLMGYDFHQNTTESVAIVLEILIDVTGAADGE